MKMMEVKTNTVPTEISISVPLSSNPSCSHVKKAKSAIAIAATATNGDKKMSSLSPETKKKKDDDDDDDDDSGITLDDLQCCVCFIGDSSDENDVLLCDGQGCYRAFHMKCIQPQVNPKDILEEDEDWFCPLCSCISNMIHDVQCNFMNDDNHHDWEERRALGDDSSSLKSWDHVDQIFPEAVWEYEAAMQLKKGLQNEDTQRLLAEFFGEDILDTTKHKNPTERVVESDDEDENDYSLFDENSFEDRRRQERQALEAKENDDDASESTRSSQASLVDMSSVELGIGRDELAALSDVHDDSSDDEQETGGDNHGGGGGRRKSRRLRNVVQHHQSEESTTRSEEVVLGADFNEANILPGKRQRKAVDYRKLNDALFGELSEKEKAQIDDAEDFKAAKSKKQRRKRVVVVKKAKEESSDDGEKGSGSEAESNNQGEDSESNNDEHSNKDEDSADSDDGSDGSDSDDQEGSDDESNGGGDDSSGSENEKEESKPDKKKATASPQKKTKSATKGTEPSKKKKKKT
jgi:hypothetical protein